MKKFKDIIILFLVGLVLFTTACEPIEDRQEMGAKLTPAQIQITAVNVAGENNRVVFKNSTPGVSGVWKWTAGGKSFDQEVTKTYFTTGSFTETFVATTAGGIVEATVDFEVTSLDVLPEPPLAYLVGEDPAGEGATWVYATDYSGTYGSFWIDYPAYTFQTTDQLYQYYDEWAPGQDPWQIEWWNPYEGGNSPGVNNEMKFDLAGGMNFTFYESAGAEGVKGSFVFDENGMTLKIVDSHIPDYDNDNIVPENAAGGEYQVKVLNENELILWQVQDESAWCWVFKRKGYNWPQ